MTDKWLKYIYIGNNLTFIFIIQLISSMHENGALLVVSSSYSASKNSVFNIQENEIDIKKAVTDLKLKFLLVDDIQINPIVAKTLLINSGIEVMTANNDKEVVEIISNDGATGEIDAVFMDIQMPIMDVYHATKLIRNELNFKVLSTIELSVNIMTEDVEKSIAVGMNVHLGKPVDIKLLLTELYSQITKARLINS